MTSIRAYGGRPGRPITWSAMALVLIAAFLYSGAVPAAETKDGPTALKTAAGTGAKISREQASEAALQALPGEVTDVTIERKRGKMVYVIEIVAKKDGSETDVLVDMDSGKVLGME